MRSEPPCVDVGHLVDVPGLRVGHHGRRSNGWLTGTTVVVPDEPAVAGVDVRGGAPGTRETDLLRPENMIRRVHAVCLSGGSAFGLAAADGVMSELEGRRRGFPVGSEPGWVVPIVPAAVIFDLGRGGRFSNRPDAGFGRRAFRGASPDTRAQGTVGAGIGARAGGLKGGVGSASMTLPTGHRVGALVVVNAVGSVIDPESGLPWHHSDFGLVRPDRHDRRRLFDHLASLTPTPSLNTTIGVLGTDFPLDKADCTKVAGVAHDGVARAVRPAHSLNDGDTLFVLSTASEGPVGPAPTRFNSEGSLNDRDGRLAAVNRLLAAAAEVCARAISAAVLNAESTRGLVAYRDLCPSAYRRLSMSQVTGPTGV